MSLTEKRITMHGWHGTLHKADMHSLCHCTTNALTARHIAWNRMCATIAKLGRKCFDALLVLVCQANLHR